MFDLGWVELSFLAVLALIIVGPKDLPKLARGAGRLWSRAQRLYRHSLNSIQRLETEIDLASGPDGRQTTDYYALLPEHVRRALEQAEPSRDAGHNERVEAMYTEAMAQVNQQHGEAPSPSPDDSGSEGASQEADHDRK